MRRTRMKNLVLLLALSILGVSCAKIEGNERAIVQDWGGVKSDILNPGTHFYNPITTDIHTYNIGTEKFIMGNKELYNGEGSEYVDFPEFVVTTGGKGKEQPAGFSITLQYRFDPAHLVSLHNKANKKYEDLVIKPALTRIISDKATELEVLEFYSGDGRVKLQKEIEQAIMNHPSLAEVGIKVETFVIDNIRLDEKFVSEISGRQLATQKKLRAVEEAKAAEEVAKREESLAKADKLKRIVEAEASKEVAIKNAEAKNEAEILAAKAAAEARILAAKSEAEETRQRASADRFRKEEDAKGALALGLAEAQVEKEKKMSKYDGIAGERQALVEMEQAKTERLKNAKINGVVSEKTFLMLSGAEGLNKPTPTIQINK